MKYEIKVSTITEVEGKSYPTTHEVYTQEVEDIDLSELIKFVNKGKDE